jgi:hypothetical protein
MSVSVDEDQNQRSCEEGIDSAQFLGKAQIKMKIQLSLMRSSKLWQ